MGDLPSTRASPSRPFINTLLDFAEPFCVKIQSLCNAKTLKVGYIYVFSCAFFIV